MNSKSPLLAIAVAERDAAQKRFEAIAAVADRRGLALSCIGDGSDDEARAYQKDPCVKEALLRIGRLVAEIERLRTLFREVERCCPCGARPESLDTHPHVISCPVAKALGSTTTADNYRAAVIPKKRK